MKIGPDNLEEAENILESNFKKGKIKLNMKSINRYYSKKYKNVKKK